jgi:multiple sugar transport system substrate-binding protein
VAVPLNPNHAYCAFLSIAHSNAGPPVLQPGKPVETDVGIEALEFLRALSSWLHPLSRDADPIIISDNMTKSDEIAYVPLMFGYSNYARPGFRPNTLCFGDAPRGRSGLIGSVLGGVGLALSAESAVAEPAADLAREICRPQTQCGLYFDSGGQPGHAEAWRSDEVNRRAGNFFQATSRSMRQALMRPRVAGHRKFQVEAGELIHGFIWDQAMEPAQCLQSFNDLVEQRLGTGESNV